MTLGEFLQGQRIYVAVRRKWWQRLLRRPEKLVPMKAPPPLDDLATKSYVDDNLT